MKKSIFTFLLFAMVITLSSCGGGGDDGATRPGNDSLVITMTPTVSSLPANTLGYPHFLGSPFETQVDIKVAFNNGQGVATGTIVHLQTNNVAVGYIGTPDDPATDENEYAVVYSGVEQETIGSVASYFLRSGSTPGTVTFTANATHPTTGRNFVKTLSFTVNEGPDPTVVQLDVIKPRTTLPVNDLNIEYFNGFPFMMETNIQFRDVFGNLTNPAPNNNGDVVVNVSINPSSSLYFTTLDDPETTDVNEFFVRLTQGQVDMNSGHGNMFLWSRDIPGVSTVTVTAIDAMSGFEISNSFDIEVIDSGTDPRLPSDITLLGDAALYINGSGGATSQNINITVTSGNLPVSDPQVNNVRLSMITDAPNSGEKLLGTNVSGSAVQGTTINVSTVNGIANATVQSGSDSNTITLTATIDRADNNVDNGIQDGVSTVKTYIVSDGVLWALELTSSALDTLVVNGETTGEGTEIEYNYQNGTYSYVVNAIGTDKGGNPALPQTLEFGMIDTPIMGYPDTGSGYFVHSSNDGDPQEGGRGFTSLSANFQTVAGGVQANDTLIVFGEESLGNEDLESALRVASVDSQTSLTTIERFNRNDETGTINNDFGILPYAVGRSVDGNITDTAEMNEMGVATTRLNYPVSQLGKVAVVYVKGQGRITNGVAKSVTDNEMMTFPGIEGFNGQSSTLTVSPNIIPANRSIGFVVCLADSARNPLPGRFIAFSYVGANGQGSIDGISTAGIMNNTTGMNGCAWGVATTTGVTPGSTESGFNFTSGGITCNLENSDNQTCLDVIAPENGVLNANPSSFLGSGSANITLTLYDGSGNPIEGVPLSGACEQVDGGLLSISAGPSLTNASGESSVLVSYALDAPGGGLTGTCTFATASGEPSVEVHFSGGDSCILVFPSPAPPSGGCDSDDQFSIGGDLTGLANGESVILQNNNGDNISMTNNEPFLFPPQDDGSVYQISILTQPATQTCTVTNGTGSISGAHVTDVVVNCM